MSKWEGKRCLVCGSYESDTDVCAACAEQARRLQWTVAEMIEHERKDRRGGSGDAPFMTRALELNLIPRDPNLPRTRREQAVYYRACGMAASDVAETMRLKEGTIYSYWNADKQRVLPDKR